ncbi:hypothetical protein ADU37_CDS10600 [Thermococcus sp. 2319x1]|nr:hypothetical protein ADU37_CDS10600 [Thermococcus sp. 2319x1]
MPVVAATSQLFSLLTGLVGRTFKNVCLVCGYLMKSNVSNEMG